MNMQNPSTYRGFRYSNKKNSLIDSNGNRVKLRPKSLAVFRYLAEHPGRVIGKEELLVQVWSDVAVTDDSLVQCISEIRKTLKDADHSVLQTIPRRGYLLIADTSLLLPNTANSAQRAFAGNRWLVHMALLLAAVLIVIAANFRINDKAEGNNIPEGSPILKIKVSPKGGESGLAALIPELRVTLSRYQTVSLSDNPDAEFTLKLDSLINNDRNAGLTVELVNTSDSNLVFAERYEMDSTQDSMHNLALRIAAAIASPGIGAIDRQLLNRSRLKPIADMSRAECYANGYGCAKCSGEEDNITKRAEECLAYILEHDPNDARAWALQATIYAHQYWWGNTLTEPQKSHLPLRKHLPEKAIEAANRAEALSGGNDSAVYWGMAEAYFASCQPDKLQTAIHRGLELNPDDPNLLASFGNWLSYSGHWDEGAALTRRALEIEPQQYRKWWWMGIAKTHYFKEEFEGAYRAFMKAYNERNWVSHLQLAYTLPFLDRLPEARQAVRSLQRLSPGITLERALEIYDILCFPDSFLENMRLALTRAGLPSRGDSRNLEKIVLPRAETIDINGLTVEYLDEGSGEPVLFVHGAISDYRSWGYYLAPISDQHRYLAYSRRYYGTQAWVDEGERWSQNLFAEDLIRLIEAINAGPVHLVSWSNGARSVIKVSIERPDLVKSIIHYEPVDHGIFTDDPSIKTLQQAHFDKWVPILDLVDQGDNELAAKRMLELVFSLKHGGHQYEREIQKEVVRQNARTLPLVLGPANETDTKLTCDYVSQTRIPTKIIYSDNTLPYWSKMAERFAECIPGSTLELLPDTSHRGPIDKVDELSGLILDFVELHK